MEGRGGSPVRTIIAPAPLLLACHHAVMPGPRCLPPTAPHPHLIICSYHLLISSAALLRHNLAGTASRHAPHGSLSHAKSARDRMHAYAYACSIRITRRSHGITRRSHHTHASHPSSGSGLVTRHAARAAARAPPRRGPPYSRARRTWSAGGRRSRAAPGRNARPWCASRASR